MVAGSNPVRSIERSEMEQAVRNRSFANRPVHLSLEANLPPYGAGGRRKQTEKMAEKVEIQDHKLIPKHAKLSDDEVQKLLEQFNISLRQLPKIMKSDPALKTIETKPGDIIKIERVSPTVGKVNFYRVVINA